MSQLGVLVAKYWFVGVAVLIFAVTFMVVYYIGRWYMTRDRRIRSYMITKTGRMVAKTLTVDEKAKFTYLEGEYNTDKRSKLLAKHNVPAFVHIEGISDPINFVDIDRKTAGNIKIDAVSLKKLLKTKLFSDLFTDDSEELKKNIMLFAIIANIVITLVIAAKVLGIVQ